uniref:CAMPATH-1 antigen n=1 Tax=Microcebus murinus TaxID=30608 RepID=A0A8C5V9J4_MICMU
MKGFLFLFLTISLLLMIQVRAVSQRDPAAQLSSPSGWGSFLFFLTNTLIHLFHLS